jgi:hypothetical protein
MSAIPPNVAGSVLQTSLVQGQAASIRDREQAQQAAAGRRQAAAIDAMGSTVETGDTDKQIHSDAEGSGSQGRPFSEPHDAEDEAQEEESDVDLETGRHVDFEA